MGVLQALTDLAATFRREDVLVLCYHRIRSRVRFADQMAALSERGFSVLSMPQFTEWLKGVPLPSRHATLLTFDGCYDDQLANAVPLLDSLKFPAIFFPASAGLVCEFPDVAAYWRNTLLDLTKAGHAIGCHTQSHPDLTQLPIDEVRREVLGSKLALEDALGQRVRAFCSP